MFVFAGPYAKISYDAIVWLVPSHPSIEYHLSQLPPGKRSEFPPRQKDSLLEVSDSEFFLETCLLLIVWLCSHCKEKYQYARESYYNRFTSLHLKLEIRVAYACITYASSLYSSSLLFIPCQLLTPNILVFLTKYCSHRSTSELKFIQSLAPF